MIGVAMLSFWHLHGADYARDVDEHPDTRIVAVWDEDRERGEREAEVRGVPFYAELAAVLADPNVDAVVVDAPTSMHEEVITAAVIAGKHVFTEKVIAATDAEATRIVQAIDASGVTAIVSMRRSDDSSTHDVVRLVREGAVGRVTFVRVRDVHPFALPTPELPDGWLPPQFYDPITAQGGTVIDLCHPLYLVAMILGRPAEVSAAMTQVTGRAVEDNAVVTMRFDDGALAIAETSYVSSISPFVIEVHGTDGVLLYDEPGIGELVDARRRTLTPSDEGSAPTGRIRIRRVTADSRPAWTSVAVSAPRPTAFARWVELVKRGQTAPDNIDLALDLTAIVEAAYRSQREQRPIPVATADRR